MRPNMLRSVGIAALIASASCAQLASVIQTTIEKSVDVRPGTVHEDIFLSDALGVRKHVVVYLPPSYGQDTSRHYPVAYYLHGLSGTETDWISKGSIDATADSLFAHGTPEMIIVLPDGDDGWYTTWTTQVRFRTCADTIRSEAADRYCVNRERYDEYIAHDVVRHIDAHYRTRADRDNRGIGGLSMGGYGALSIAMHYADVFGAAASHSGVLSPMYSGPKPFAPPARYASTVDELHQVASAYWSRYTLFWGTDLERWRAADPAHIAEAMKRRGQHMPSIFFDCGRDDPFIEQNRALDAELTRLGISHSFAEWPGAHTWRYWSTHVGESLAWMARRID
jgi:S-formylglutathione hydrolase FrmB